MSYETIYRSLYIQARGVLKKGLLEHLRAKRTIRRSRHANLKGYRVNSKILQPHMFFQLEIAKQAPKGLL